MQITTRFKKRLYTGREKKNKSFFIIKFFQPVVRADPSFWPLFNGCMRIGALQISNSWIWQYVERRDTKPFPNFVCRVCDKQYATGGAIDSICCHFRKKKQSEEVYRVSFDALTNAEYDVQQLEIAEDVDLENLPRI